MDAGRIEAELTRLALANAGGTVPLQLAAMAMVAGMGWMHGQRGAALVTAGLALVVGVWRLWLARRHGRSADGAGLDIAAVERGLTANALLTGAMWLVATVTILPVLPRNEAAVYLLIVCGSIVIAAGFMPLVGQAFKFMVALQIAGLAIVVVDAWSLWSVAAVVLFVMFGQSLLRVALGYRNTVAGAIQSSLLAGEALSGLQAARDAQQAASEAKSRFLATMSHEIRTPMNGVLGAIDLLRHAGLTPPQYALAATAASSGESLLRIVNDVLDHARLESGDLELIPAPTDLRALGAAVVRLFEANARSKGLRLELDTRVEQVPQVCVDAHRLKQVLMNLVGNAIKFTDAGEVAVRILARRADATTAEVLLEVRDTGVGMDAQVRSRLFEPFFQDRRTMRQGGSGLGLAICQRIVRQMGGTIAVLSQPGQGSTVRVELGLEIRGGNVQRDEPDSAFAPDSAQVLCGQVLLVDDNEVNRFIGVQMLRTLGLRVQEACDGAEALRALQSTAFDLVLMDVEMPVLDGLAATRAQRARERALALPRVPIVAVTANAFDSDVRASLAAGMDGHLAKPFTRARMRDELARWLRPGP